jgi:tetratricopeptide (TPR) repeat protein
MKFAVQDTAKSMLLDSLALSKLDTTQKYLYYRKLAFRSVPSADSLATISSGAAHELGDVFHNDLEEPDSAYIWYTHALAWHYDRRRSPQVLYILAGLSQKMGGTDHQKPETFYEQLDKDFPDTRYAEEARRFLGKSNVPKIDSAWTDYRVAERLLDVHQYEKALQLFDAIGIRYPRSPFAPKSEFAAAWIWENCLSRVDSAQARYKRITKRYPGSPYASAATKRYLDPADTLAVPVKQDTARAKPSQPNILPPRGGFIEKPDSTQTRPLDPHDMNKRRQGKILNDQ